MGRPQWFQVVSQTNPTRLVQLMDKNYCVVPEQHDIGFLLVLNYGLIGLKEYQPQDYHRGVAFVEEVNRQRGIKNSNG